MSFYTILAFSFSIVVSGIIGAVRIKKIAAAYYPFLYLLWVGACNEFVTFFLISRGKSNAVSGNIYSLVEGILIVYQLKKWRLFERSKFTYYFITLSFLLFWAGEAFIFRSIKEFLSYYLIFHSFSITLLSISMINQLLATATKKLTRNATYIICVGFIIYFTYAALVEVFYLYGLTSSTQFETYITRILAFVNLFTNLLYALAVLWMPRKQEFSL